MTRDDTLSLGVAPTSFRLPAARLGPVRLAVRDLPRSVDWYQGILGLRPVRSEGRVALLGSGDPLVELREQPGAAPVPRRGRLGLFHYALLLPDRAALGRFVRHLTATNTPFGASDHQVSEALYLRDPDGHGIEVYADRPRSAWRARPTPRGAELLMSTDPLDLDAVTAAAAGAPWAGMPVGTVVGHIHLHVGDLERARRFYHGILGLDEMVWSYPGALFFAAGGYHHHVGVNVWAGEAAAGPGTGDARLLEWTLEVPAPSAAPLIAALAGAGHDPDPQQAGGWLVSDPWGTRLRLVAAR